MLKKTMIALGARRRHPSGTRTPRATTIFARITSPEALGRTRVGRPVEDPGFALERIGYGRRGRLIEYRRAGAGRPGVEPQRLERWAREFELEMLGARPETWGGLLETACRRQDEGLADKATELRSRATVP
ncbi:MAG: hypothetical protein HY319_20390 [Armatimonadetes bacterium]|nr:hypothetical protein [Armatimonadota bacterium]